jgi:bifunctional N-acetylglucosamine-1-phosphate-uridyltransferase/glucosamine-1-phosphate-acetyltransferase GlmU-like protein
MKVRKAVIPAAGFGTRMLPITSIVPKELLPVCGRPVIEHVIKEAPLFHIAFTQHPQFLKKTSPGKQEIIAKAWQNSSNNTRQKRTYLGTNHRFRKMNLRSRLHGIETSKTKLCVKCTLGVAILDVFQSDMKIDQYPFQNTK